MANRKRLLLVSTRVVSDTTLDPQVPSLPTVFHERPSFGVNLPSELEGRGGHATLGPLQCQRRPGAVEAGLSWSVP